MHITEDRSKDSLFKGKRTAVLTIPSGGEFEFCEYWQLRDGIGLVQKRQKTEPWNKYLQKKSDAQRQSFEVKINDEPIMSYPTEDRNEKSPQNEDLYKKIKKVRKEMFGAKNGPKEPKTDSSKNETKTSDAITEVNRSEEELEESGPQTTKPPADGKS